MKYITLLFWLFASGVATAQFDPSFSYTKAKDTLIYKKAENLYFEGRYNEALKELDKLPQRNYSQEAGSSYLKGRCFYWLDQYDKATEAFTIALSSEPEAIEIYSYRGDAFMRNEKYKIALSDFTAYAVHFPQEVDVALSIANCMEKLGQVDAAIQYLERFEPKDTIVYLNLGYYYTEYKENHPKGIEMLEKALSIDSTYADAIENLSIAYGDLGNYDKAFKLINKLITMKPNYGRAYYLKGSYEEEIGMEDLAAKCFKIARENGYTWDEEMYYEGEESLED